MLKEEPRAFWMIVNLVTLVLGVTWFFAIHDYIGDNAFRESGWDKIFYIYVAAHFTLIGLHAILLLALPSKD
jgi:hypothetical protein